MSQETEQIKERLDLAEVVGEYVQLKRVGNHFKARCPFHEEKTPSFIVSPDKGIWHCFGCSEGGDIFSFVERVEGIDFVAALKLLADKAGVELKKVSPEQRSKKMSVYDALTMSARYYHEILMRQPIGRKAKEYLIERGVKEKTMELFNIGYAPQGWDHLQKFLQHKGFNLAEMVSAGLVGRSQNGKTYDRFRGRIMFPVYSVHDRVIAFGGRIVPWHETGGEGKYVNSPETEIYEKRQVVYNLNRAKKVLRHKKPAIVVEGYMDVAMLVQSGYENVVASSGTAFTPEHVKLLQRFTDTLHFAFDGDSAGIKAAQSATEEALLAGMRVSTIVFPAGKDPADMAIEGKKVLSKYIDKPTSLVSLLLDRLKGVGEDERTSALNDVLPIIKKASNPVQQGKMIQEVVNILHVPESTLHKKMNEIKEAMTIKSDEVDSKEMVLAVDQQLLGFIIADEVARKELFSSLQEDYFLDQGALNLYKQLQQLMLQKSDFLTLSSDELINALPETSQALAESLYRLSQEYIKHSSQSAEQEARQLLVIVQHRFMEVRLQKLERELATSSGEEKEKVMKEIKELIEEKAKITNL